jgi:sarcosine oxidase delta subunit
MQNNGHDEFDDFLEVDDMPDDPPSPTNRDRAQSRGYRPAYEKSARKPADERDASFNALAWLIEGATGLVEELRHNDLGLSEEFWVHAAAARREGLMAARAVLDQLLEETEQQQSEERQRQERQTRRGGINVDF